MPVHLIIMTDDDRGIDKVRSIFMEEHPPVSLFNYLKSGKTVPRFTLEFVDVKPILDLVSGQDGTMMKFFNNHGGKYAIFYKDHGEEEEVKRIG